jgi:hypothetical protein
MVPRKVRRGSDIDQNRDLVDKKQAINCIEHHKRRQDVALSLKIHAKLNNATANECYRSNTMQTTTPTLLENAEYPRY